MLITVEQPARVEPPRIVSFTTSETAIREGKETTLRWETQNATNVTISPGIGHVDAKGEKTLRPDGKTTYTLTAAGPAEASKNAQ